MSRFTTLKTEKYGIVPIVKYDKDLFYEDDISFLNPNHKRNIVKTKYNNYELFRTKFSYWIAVEIFDYNHN